MAVVVTGSSGFIGFHLCAALRARGESPVGIDRVDSDSVPTISHASGHHALRRTPRGRIRTDLRALVRRQVEAGVPALHSTLQEVG